MAAISVNPDAYGKYARVSAVADFAELVAWLGEPITRDSLADYLYDIESSLPERHFLGVGEYIEEAEYTGDEDVFDDSAQFVFDLLEERAHRLNSRYPFCITGTTLESTAGDDTWMYHVLLAITVAHAYGIDAGGNPRELLEDVAARLLVERGWRAVNFSRVRSGHGDFRNAVESAGNLLGIMADPTTAPQAIAANDSGVDALAHHDWGDSRTGRVFMIGQVTCARSDDWSKKLHEPQTEEWKRYMDTSTDPIAFLAIPHHAQLDHFNDLTVNSKRIVIDRIRLVLSLTDPTEEERAIVESVRRMGVEYR